MALHELCTNALKYGSLSCASGRVSIAWSLAGTGEERLHLVWREHGGPPVARPQHKGFGTRLIEHGLARELNGSVQVVYEPTGVVCTIDVPLDAGAAIQTSSPTPVLPISGEESAPTSGCPAKPVHDWRKVSRGATAS